MLPMPNTVTRTVKSATDPVYVNAAHSQIKLNVVFKELEALGSIPFTASETDPENHGRVIFSRAVAGDFGPVGPYVPLPEDALS
jgi:hypothetical protein